MATHKSQIETAISRLNETAYGVARAAGDDWRRILNDAQNVTELDTAFEDDANYDSGSDLPSDMWATFADATNNFSPDFCFQDIGYFLMDALGGYSSSTLYTGHFSHTFSPQNVGVSRQLPSRTVLKKYGGIKYLMTPGNVLTQLKISGGKTERLKTSATYKGSGDYEENPASYVTPAITDDREWAYGTQAFFRFNDDSAGTKQVETATAAGTVTGPGDAEIIVTASGLPGSPVQVLFAVANTDAAATWAAKARAALKANKAINSFFEVSGATTAIILTKRVKEADDATLNIAIDNDTSAGITAAPTSANTTAGVAGDYQSYTCDLETWELTIDNPAADEGYRQCSEYVVADNPKSGVIRKEYLVGLRSYMFDFTARLATGDKMRNWLKAGTDLQLEIPIVGIDTNDHSLRIVHTKARVMVSKESADIGGFIGVTGQVKLMSESGAIPFTAVLINDVASYVS